MPDAPGAAPAASPTSAAAARPAPGPPVQDLADPAPTLRADPGPGPERPARPWPGRGVGPWIGLVALVAFGAGAATGWTLRGPARRVDRRIDVTGEVLAGLRADFARRAGRDPDATEVQALVRRHVEQEMLLREALAQGLDQGDIIVRRRLIQRMELGAEEAAARATPDDAELEGELRRDPGRYQRPARVGFTHVYYRRDPAGRERAAASLARLRAGADPAREGEPFVAGNEVAPASEREIASRFGAAFAAALFALPASDAGAPVAAATAAAAQVAAPATAPIAAAAGWTGPIESALGLHLVRVTAREAARPATLAEARAEISRDLIEHRRAHAREQLLDKLRPRYLVREPGSAAGGTP